jgi:hypothetical protein
MRITGAMMSATAVMDSPPPEGEVPSEARRRGRSYSRESRS